MAESKKNLATEGLSGQVGNFVFRRRKSDGKIMVSRHPGTRESEPTEAQKLVNEKFQQAVIYGKSVNADPVLKAQYQAAAKPGQSAYNVAVSDYFRAPDIQEINLNQYTGQVGDEISIKVTDDFGVQQTSVKIENGDGSLVEEGLAVQSQDLLHWIYTATAANASLTGDKITVTVTDRPQNVSVEEEVL